MVLLVPVFFLRALLRVKPIGCLIHVHVVPPYGMLSSLLHIMPLLADDERRLTMAPKPRDRLEAAVSPENVVSEETSMVHTVVIRDVSAIKNHCC